MGYGVAAEPSLIHAAILAVGARLAGMLQDLQDTDIAIPGSEWTVGETAAHLAYTNVGLTLMAKGFVIPYGDGTAAGLAEANALSLDAYPVREGPLLARGIVDGLKSFVAEAAAQPPGGVYETPMGTVDMGTLEAYVLTHNLMHGCAIAQGVGAPPPFSPDHAALAWPFLSHMMPVVFDRSASDGVRGRVRIDVEGSMSADVVLEDGDVRVESAGSAPADCYLAADPLTFFLVWVRLLKAADAVERGDMTIRGDRPDLGLLLQTLLVVP
jgi:hypothetical protein